MEQRKFYAIEVTTENGVKCLAFKLSKFKNELFFCEGNGGGKFTPTPAPELYTSRKAALLALDGGVKKSIKASVLEKTFANIISSKKVKVVPITISWGKPVI